MWSFVPADIRHQDLPFLTLEDRTDDPDPAPTGTVRLYAKAGKVHSIDDQGTVTVYAVQ
jgi:hypothetical protein